tara:strand:+ start:165 stop:1181 length:1017 start_codon:yes stop_codon:yes gene_type:complete
MSEEITEETTVDSEDEEVPEMTIDERKDALKKSRWNVFMYLGLAVVLFGFALYPFMSLTLNVEEGVGSVEETVTVFGLPVPGEDVTDIPVEVEIVVQSVPTDIRSIEVFMIENKKGCNSADGSIEKTAIDLQNGESEYPNSYQIIENPVESQTYDLEFGVDPGAYCLIIVSDSPGNDFSGINIQSQIDLYPNQLPLALIGAVSLLLSIFAFIGAQKHGKFVKNLVEPKADTIEDSVLQQTVTSRVAAGPSGPPSPGPTGPPVAGPTGPPAPGPTGPPAAGPTGAPSAESTPAEVTVESDVYEDQGDGWFFRKLPDGSYDQTVYVVENGQYVPYVEPAV